VLDKDLLDLFILRMGQLGNRLETALPEGEDKQFKMKRIEDAIDYAKNVPQWIFDEQGGD